LNRTNINVYEWPSAVLSRKTKPDCSRLFSRPFDFAMLTIDETRNMFDEMFKAEKDYVKGYK